MKKFTNSSVINLQYLADQIGIGKATLDTIVKYFREKFEVEEGMELSCINKNGKYGYADENGSLIIGCQKKEAEDLSEGIAWVKKNGEGWEPEDLLIRLAGWF